jgi:hypothetical protein
MLDDLGNESLVSSSDLPGNPFCQVQEGTAHPVLPEDTDTSAERCKISLDHAECPMNRPEYEEDDHEVVRVPESFEICPLLLLHCGPSHECERDYKDVSRPSRTSQKVQLDESFKANLVDGRKSGHVVQMGDGVNPGKEHDGPGSQFMEGDVFVKRNDAVERCAPEHRDEVPANGEE